MHCSKISLFSQLKTSTSRQMKLEDVFRSPPSPSGFISNAIALTFSQILSSLSLQWSLPCQTQKAQQALCLSSSPLSPKASTAFPLPSSQGEFSFGLHPAISFISFGGLLMVPASSTVTCWYSFQTPSHTIVN